MSKGFYEVIIPTSFLRACPKDNPHLVGAFRSRGQVLAALLGVMVSGTQTSLLHMALKFYEESLSLIQPELSIGSSVDMEQKRKLGHDWAGEVVRLRDKPKWNDRLFTSGYSYAVQGHVLVRLLVTQKCKRNLDGTSSIEVCSVRVVFLWPVW